MAIETALENTPTLIRVDVGGDLPIYLQIKYQLSYLISTEKLAAGARLPAVRTLANTLGLNFHTVAQAYRELVADGLIESTPGRGSFVREFGDLSRTQAARQERLNDVLQEAREAARALGFDDAEILQRLSSIAHQYPVACHVAYVDKVPHTAAKYARLVGEHLNGTVQATALSLEEVEQRSPRAREVLSKVFYIVTVARNVPKLEKLLPFYATTHDIITIVAEIMPDTTSSLSTLDPDTHAILLTEEHYLYSSLNLVALHSELDPQGVEAFILPDTDKFVEAARNADIILYTFGVLGDLEALDLPGKGIDIPRLELAFDISPDSVQKLRGVFDPASG